jgi:hypothetical protein
MFSLEASLTLWGTPYFKEIPTAFITDANPARATELFKSFTLRLQDPFDAGVCTRLSPVPCSLYHRFYVYSFSSQP